MAMTPEDKVARAVSRAFDSMSLNTRLAASFTISNMSTMVQSKFFDFIIYCLGEYRNQNAYSGYRREVVEAICKAIEDTGYQLEKTDL